MNKMVAREVVCSVMLKVKSGDTVKTVCSRQCTV